MPPSTTTPQTRFECIIQGHTARNLSLSEVSSLTGLDRLEVRELFLASSFPYTSSDSAKRTMSTVSGTLALLTSDGELRSAGGAFYIDHSMEGNGTLLAPRIGPHDVAGDVDFLGHVVRNAVLENPSVRWDVRRDTGCLIYRIYR